VRRKVRHMPAGSSGLPAGAAARRESKASQAGSRPMAVRARRGVVGGSRMAALYRIRSAVPADAEAFFAIEQRSLSDPWSEASFREALTSPWTFGIAAQGSRGGAGYLI